VGRFKVFYSWQSDTPHQENRDFIREALGEAVSSFGVTFELDEATRGEPGSPDIPATILSKIKKCAIFVPDVTLIGTVGKRAVLNPNVAIEYGIALATLDTARIIPILNRSHGGPESLPFDMKHREVKCTYTLAPNSSREDIERTRKQFAQSLRDELETVRTSGALFGGLSQASMSLVEFLVSKSETGSPGNPSVSFTDACQALKLSRPSLVDVVSELEAKAYVDREEAIDDDFRTIAPTQFLFWDFDPIFKDWDPRRDAQEVVVGLLEAGKSMNRAKMGVRDFADRKGWTPRRVNPALHYLSWGQVVATNEATRHPWAFEVIMERPETRQFALGKFNPDNLRRRGGT